MSVRTEKVGEEIKHQLNIAMSKDLSEMELGLVTISKVLVSPDLKIAKVYISFLGNKEPAAACIKQINIRKKHIRWLLGQKLTIRYTPDLVFFHDDTIEYSDKMNKLLKEIHDKDEQNKIENLKLKTEMGFDTEEYNSKISKPEVKTSEEKSKEINSEENSSEGNNLEENSIE